MIPGYARPISLFDRIRSLRKPKSAALSKLYVLKSNFPITEDKATELDNALEPLRKKFGIDFFVLEPGITISRFDEI